MDDEAERLSREESDSLKHLLLYLRYIVRHQYVYIARKIGVEPETLWNITAGRTRGTKNIKDKLIAYCKDRNISVDERSGIGVGYNIVGDLSISEEILQKASAELAGRYLAYTLTIDNKIAVSLVTMYNRRTGNNLPEFAGWRPHSKGHVQYKGVYYKYEGGIYMLGHMINTGYPRLICASENFNNKKISISGTVSTATTKNLSVNTWTYMDRYDHSLLTMRRKEWDMLGTFDFEEVKQSSPHVHEYFQGKAVHSIDRPPPAMADF